MGARIAAALRVLNGARLSAATIRRFLCETAATPSWAAQHAANRMRVDAAKVDRVLAALSIVGYIERDPLTAACWRVTDVGRRHGSMERAVRAKRATFSFRTQYELR